MSCFRKIFNRHAFPILVPCLFAMLLLWSCQPNAPSGNIDQNLSPEEVLKIYQSHYDRNEFELAKKYSTLAEQERLDELAQIIAQEISDSTILKTSFLAIDCSVSGDTARCLCDLEDQYEKYQANFQLIRSGLTWLVDAPHEEQLRIDEELNKLMDSLLHPNQ